MPNNSLSWLWWVFSTVILAIIINVISDYIKPKVDHYLEKYSTKRRELSELESNEIMHKASEMRNKIELANLFYFSYIRLAIFYTVFMIGFIQSILAFFVIASINQTGNWTFKNWGMFFMSIIKENNIVALAGISSLMFGVVLYIMSRNLMGRMKKMHRIFSQYRILLAENKLD